LIVLVLSLGIGGNAAIFTLLKAAFLDPLPYRDARRLVTIGENTGWFPNGWEFLEIRGRNRTLERVAFAEHVDMQLTGNGEPTRVFAARVSASFFPLLGVNAARGRTFLDEENQPGRSPAVILSDAFWRSRTGADARIVGRTLRLDGQPAVVVGILPPGFQFDYPTLRVPEPVDLYVSSPIERIGAPGASSNDRRVPVLVIGRLRPAVTVREAQSDMRRVARELTQEHPEAFPNPQHDPSLFTFLTVPLRDAIIGAQRSLLWLLLTGSGVLLLIACANTAQLLLPRSLRRARNRHPLGPGRRPTALDSPVSYGGNGARGVWRRGRIAGRSMDRAHPRRATAGAQPAARLGTRRRARHRIHLGHLARLRDRLRHYWSLDPDWSPASPRAKETLGATP
jgi:putative ABC transport system permease protein